VSRTLAQRRAKTRAAHRHHVFATAAALTATLLTGCSSATSPTTVEGNQPARATAPYLLMTTPTAGYVTWPAGDQWVLLATRDGWRTITNATPVAVPTGGGLVIATAASQIAAAVGPYQQLTESPVLSRDVNAADWEPQQLPGAVVDDRHALAFRASELTATVAAADGTVVAQENGQWMTLVTGQQLAARGLHLDTITWASASTGWITGHGTAGTPLAFTTRDSGAHWSVTPVTGSTATAALAPCGAGQQWMLPVIGNGQVTVWRTADQGGDWHAGASLLQPSGPLAWGCAGSEVWIAARDSQGQDRVFSSSDAGQSWTGRGPSPAGLTSLAPGPGGHGYATSHSGPTNTLWSVDGDGARFDPRAIPDWVAAIAGQNDSTS
jgi:hypothetical protein